MIREVEAKSILRKHKRIDSWFISCYGMNLYRGCAHNCVYCDGRAETYQVNGEFGTDVTVKSNAIGILKRELDPKRKRKPMKRCYIMMGGGVNDSYQPIEHKYELTRQALQLVYEFGFPASILTKSTLVLRDIDIIKKINKQNRAIVSFSLSSTDDEISAIFEPGVPPPSKRLEAIKTLTAEGITCGMFLMPTIPYITDTAEVMEQTISQACNAGIKFIIFSGMTLKEGRQKDYFSNVLRQHYPDLAEEYRKIYMGNQWGGPTQQYHDSINKTFFDIAKRYKIPVRIPSYLYTDLLDENDLVAVMLDQIDYMLKLRGQKSPHGYASYVISKIDQPLSDLRTELSSIRGIGKSTEMVILEIIKTGRSSYYEKLLNWQNPKL
ncbi:MAG: radical SAM protein [Chloroflexi bacterium]|nr:radical SAM protein [Chloroflexota bacterium]MBT7082257.1 radical SAM protein [Chloroflexota bacterium]MBT7289548.1 radical SAM protein [Chloroflexota bacterium]